MALYQFKLPKFSELTDSQKIAVNTVEPIALSGSPGTGKSVVSVWRHLYNCKDGKKCLLLTYTKTLSKSLELICRSENNLTAANNVGRTQQFQYNIHTKPHYDEIIVDEAQDMPIEFYEVLKGKASKISYGADDSQILYPENCCQERTLKNLFSSNESSPLDRNFRNTFEIMSFVRSLFPHRTIPLSLMNDLKNDSSKRGAKPVFFVTDVNDFDKSSSQQDKIIADIIKEYHSDGHNLAILVPFQNWVDAFHEIVKAQGFNDCSFYKSDLDNISDIKNIHVTTFKSAKGLEFDTVIIPNFQKIKTDLSRFNVEENDYYVAVTRARRNLYLLSNTKIYDLDSNTYNLEE